jgi:hypothetical protein
MKKLSMIVLPATLMVLAATASAGPLGFEFNYQFGDFCE